MLNKMGIFLNDWDSVEGMMRDFQISEQEMEGVYVLLADYTYEDYSGSAFVLFARNGKLYEVNGSHCSCYGLEDQWEPDEVLLQELINRPKNNYTHSSHGQELEEILRLIELTDVDSVITAMLLSR